MYARASIALKKLEAILNTHKLVVLSNWGELIEKICIQMREPLSVH